MIIYVSGKMTGVEHFNRPAFNFIAEHLVRTGHRVINPASLPFGLTYDAYMDISFAMVRACEAIYMIDGWQTSRGAKLELDYAKSLGKQVIYGKAL